MPMQLDRYPADWKAISLRIRERDKWCCKWCGLPNGVWIYRDAGEAYVLAAQDRGEAEMEAPVGVRVTKVVLTVAHLGTPHADGRSGDKHDKMDVRDENLAALCQACHLRYDLEDHMRNAAETRRRQKVARGQQELGL